jgi:DNA-binding LytR/AlgR family response regulator
VIIDDEPLAIDVLRRYIHSLPQLSLVGAFEDPIQAFGLLQQREVDLLFLDIQMPGLTGLQLLKSIRNAPKVILTTAYREYAVEGFELDVFDYLVKPISKERFLKSIDKLRQPPKENAGDFILIKVNKEIVRLKYDDILAIEGLKNYVKVITANKQLIAYHTIGYLESRLPSEMFKRIHKSFIVNFNHIEKIAAGAIDIQGRSYPIGKSYSPEVDKILKERLL